MVCSQSLPISQPRLQSGSRQIGHSAPSGPHSIPSLIMIWQCVKTNSTPVVHIKIAGKWMFIPLKMVLIGIDPYPFCSRFVDDKCCTVTIRNTYCREAQFSNLRVTKKHGSLHMTADPVRLDTQMGHVACRTWGTS
jgi:hypothetical protein